MNIQNFNSKEKTLHLIQNYGLVVCDECHHVASDFYGKNILEAIRQTNTPFLGLTATPLRMDGIDIRNEFASVVNGLSNFDAIRLGLMPQFTYRIGVPDKSLAEYRKRMIEEEKNNGGKKIRDYSMATDVIWDIATTYPRKKYIVFSSDIDAVSRDTKVIQNAIPFKELFYLYTGSGDREEIINRFNDAEEGILMTVDMALEGLHLKDVDGIILFRNVQSVPVFEQILGRVCSIGKTISPVVIDCSACGANLLKKLIDSNNQRKSRELESESLIDMDNLDFLIEQIRNKEDTLPNLGEEKKANSQDSLKNTILNRDIFHIALGAHEEWKDIETFEKEWAKADPYSHHTVRNARVLKAVQIYNNSKNQWGSLPNKVIEELKLAIATQCGITYPEFESAIQNQEGMEPVEENELDEMELE